MAPNFRIIESEINGDITININTQINNLNANEVVVTERVKARLFGKIHKSLTLKEGSHVILHGTLYGVVKNEGGELTLLGDVSR
jgi:hypothetical protein